MSWTATDDTPGISHVIPDDDVLEHDESNTCDCEPIIEIIPEGQIIRHNAYDGREHLEPDHSRWDCKFCIQEPIKVGG